MGGKVEYLIPVHACWEVGLADISSDLPFVGWTRIFHDQPTYPLTVLKKNIQR